MKSISVITVNFRQPDVTISLMESIKKYPSTLPVEVIVVDNGSENSIEERLQSVYPGVKYVRSEENIGFAGGNNLGIAEATGDYLLFLNNDTEITENLFDVLSSTLENNPQVGMVSPLILYFDQPDLIQYAGFTAMNYKTCRNQGIGSMEVNKGQFDNTNRETAYCHGAAMMCRRADLRTVGLMEENFFLYYEELDWCEKFRRAGKIIWFTGQTKIYHKESVSVGKESSIKTYFMTRNRLLFIRRNTSLFNTAIFSFYYVLLACPKQILKYTFSGRRDLIKWVLKGLLWNLFNRRNSKKLGYKL